MTKQDVPLQLEVGKYYRTRNGSQAVITEHDRDCTFPCEGIVNGEKHSWQNDGRWIDAGEHLLDLIAPWTDPPDHPKTPAEMSDAEIGAILRAHHAGQVVELYAGIFDWQEWDGVNLLECHQPVRVRPPEPVRKTVAMTGHNASGNGWSFVAIDNFHDTHRISFDTVDGKPDPDSIRMERVND